MYKQGRLAPKQYALDSGVKAYCACDPLQSKSSITFGQWLYQPDPHELHYVQRRPTAYKFLHTHSVLLRLPLTTADEKLSKVTAPW